MTSRPNKKGSPLPSFLQKVYDRSASYLTTDKSFSKGMDVANLKVLINDS